MTFCVSLSGISITQMLKLLVSTSNSVIVSLMIYLHIFLLHFLRDFLKLFLPLFYFKKAHKIFFVIIFKSFFSLIILFLNPILFP